MTDLTEKTIAISITSDEGNRIRLELLHDRVRIVSIILHAGQLRRLGCTLDALADSAERAMDSGETITAMAFVKPNN